MGRVVHFEIHAENPEKAIKFYQSVFNWQFNRWGEQEYWLVITGKPGERGIDGGLMKRQGDSPVKGQEVNSYVCTVEVNSVDESVIDVESNGGKIVVPKMPIPGVGWLAYCNDTEGNIFGIMHNDPEAK
jgi:predicted enzyme related to lactoylglutathione lyase